MDQSRYFTEARPEREPRLGKAKGRQRLHLALCLLLVVLTLLGAFGLSSSALAAAPCPNEQLRSESAVDTATGQPYSMALPDCRAYELVTPASGKDSAFAMGVVGLSSDGETVAYDASTAFGESASNPLTNTYEARRGEGGWATILRNPPSAALRGKEPLGGPWVSADATMRLFEADGEPGANEVEFLIGEPDGSIVDTVPNKTATKLGGGASSEFSTLVEKTQVTGDFQITDAGGASPRLQRLGVRNNGEVISECKTELGSNASDFHAISEDGTTVFFTAGSEGAGCRGPAVNEVYAQVDATEAVDISEPSVADCGACDTSPGAQKDAVFQGASSDGSLAFFTTEQELFSGQRGENIYDYDFDNEAGHKVVLVSAGSVEPRVQGVVGISDDGSHVYFVAQGVLTTAKNGVGEEADAGADNMYVFEQDTAHPTGHTQFVGELCSGPEVSGTVSDPGCAASLNSTFPEFNESKTHFDEAKVNDTTLWDGEDRRPAQITPDGQFLVFDSYASLTPDKTSTAQAVYLFDAATGSLVRVSVGQSGYDADGNNNAYNATIPIEPHSGQEDPAGDVSDLGAVSEDGGYVFFDSAEALTLDAVAGVEHVYEYHEGQVYLISDGHDQGGATFDRATLSGSDVFFASNDALVGQDEDPATENIYDARIDGGFPAPPPAAASACSGEACQGPASPAPLLQPPTSAAFTGGANVTPPVAGKPEPSAIKPLTRAQKLAKALRACKREKSKRKRRVCEKQAKRKYAAKATPKQKRDPKEAR